MNPSTQFTLARGVTGLAMLFFVLYLPGQANATDLTLTTGGKVSIELISSDAAFSNTMSIVLPGTVVKVSSGCQLEPSPELTGVKVVSEKQSQHGCRVTLDADSGTAGIQPFLAGTTIRFNMCSQENADPNCEHVWSSNPALNSDGTDHLNITTIHAAEFPGRIFQLGWEDLSGGGDLDFNDLIAVLRVEPDSDGDGLWDDWEQFGIDANGDGTIDLDLPGLGANPQHKDIFLEIDFMDCAVAGSDCVIGDTHRHRPKPAAVAAVVAAFANASVNNPDLTTGINLHVDISNSIAHQNNLNIPGLCFAGGAGIGNFDTVKADPANFGPNNPRRFAFHYSLWTHQQVSTSTSSGCAELPGNDFQVSLGGWNVLAGDIDGDGLSDADVGTIQQQAGTLMHEFGHNLNLQHGGGDGLNFKPNYLSVMSYRFQTVGIPPTDPDGIGPLTSRIDYSRSVLAALNETNLSEPAGIADGTDTTFFNCPLAVGGIGSGPGTGALNWNCDADSTDVAVTNDINGDGVCIGPGNNNVRDTAAASGDDVVLGNFIFDGTDRTCNTAKSGDDLQFRPVGNVQSNVLSGFDDWSNVKYDLQTTGAFADGDHTSLPVIELDYPTHLAVLAADLTITQSASPNPVLTGSNVTYTITVNNTRPGTATSVVVADLLPIGTTFVSCSANTGGVCAGLGNMRTVTFAEIPGGASATIEIVAAVNCDLANGATITNSANVSSDPADVDLTNNFSTATVTTSNPAPVISGESVNKTVLSPTNHKLIDITVSYDVTDNCGSLTNALSVSSNEPINGLGQGNTSPDWEIVDAHHLRLRAERSGIGTGRIYTITITSTDSAGNSSSKQLFVSVPHDRR
ncbi:MAG TPA: DUF4114 domain-containing protein [Pyrinomonadaceae bacterium]|nr:DUF4114 domain-containing protein [Pyrinomonadaceae bacterium]